MQTHSSVVQNPRRDSDHHHDDTLRREDFPHTLMLICIWTTPSVTRTRNEEERQTLYWKWAETPRVQSFGCPIWVHVSFFPFSEAPRRSTFPVMSFVSKHNHRHTHTRKREGREEHTQGDVETKKGKSWKADVEERYRSWIFNMRGRLSHFAQGLTYLQSICRKIVFWCLRSSGVGVLDPFFLSSPFVT